MIRYINLLAHFNKGTVLLRREVLREMHYCGKWSISLEHKIPHDSSYLVEVNTILWKEFGIDASVYGDKFAEIKRNSTIIVPPNSEVTIVMMKLNSSIAFQTPKEVEYKARRWSDVLSDIFRNSINPKPGYFPIHTPNSINVVRHLEKRGEFD